MLRSNSAEIGKTQAASAANQLYIRGMLVLGAFEIKGQPHLYNIL